MAKRNSPFLIGKTATGGTFIDRTWERERLAINFRSGINSILISPRRWGKSSLVKQVALDMKKEPKIRFAFMDLFHVRSEEEFLERMAEAVFKALAGTLEERMRDVKTFIRGVIPQVGFGADSQSEFTLKLSWPDGQRNIQELLDMPERMAKSKKVRLVLCIDEFQNIAQLPDPKGFQKVLRASWQHHQHVCHVIYGSKRHMMLDIFTKSNMPFYKFGDVTFLNKIPSTDWVTFILKRFAGTKKKITPEAANWIVDEMESHSHHVQLLSHACWTLTSDLCDLQLAKQALEDLMDQHDPLYHRLVDDLSTPQLNYLRALLNGVERMYSAETLRTYGLGTSGNVKRVINALEQKEILDFVGTNSTWIDPMFRHWLEKRYWGHRLKP